MQTDRLETERLILYVSSTKLLHKVYDFIVKNKDFLAEWEPKRSAEYYTLEQQKANLKKDEQGQKVGTDIRFWFAEKKQQDIIIGSVGLGNILMGNFCSAFLGYKTDQEQQGKGYMTEALGAVCEFAFYGAQLHRLEANILPRNKASLAVVQKLGFRQEGLAKKYLEINGAWEDHLHMVRLAE